MFTRMSRRPSDATTSSTTRAQSSSWPQIRLDDLGPAALAAHHLGRLLGVGPRRAIDQRDVGAAARQVLRHHGADALAAGDERDAIGQLHSV